LAAASVIEYELNHAPFKRSLDPLAGEVVGARLMHKLNIGAPIAIRCATSAEAKTAAASGDWVVKTFQEGRLKFGGTAAENVLIGKLPGAISLVSLRLIHGIENSAIKFRVEGVPLEEQADFGHMFRVLYLGRQEIANAEHFFRDFVLPDDLTNIKAAIEWDSPQMLAIHAARLFLGCSTAHAGNVLVDANGKLYSIDHEICECTNGGELAALFKYTKKVTRAWRVLAGVAALEPTDVERLFDDLPEQVTWPLRSKYETVYYFLERLDFWKKHFF